MMALPKRARRMSDNNIQVTITPFVPGPSNSNNSNINYINDGHDGYSGNGKRRKVRVEDFQDYPIDYSNHNSSASSSDTECNIVEVNPEQLLYDAINHDPLSDGDEPEEFFAPDDPSQRVDSNVGLNKNQIVALTTNLCHKIRKLTKYELVTQNGHGGAPQGEMNIPLPTPIIDLNALDAYTAFQLSKNYLLQQPELQAAPEINSAITAIENVHHYEIQSKYGNGSSPSSPSPRNGFVNTIISPTALNLVAQGHGQGHENQHSHTHSHYAKNGHGHDTQSLHQLRRLSERHFPSLIPPTAANPKPRKRCYVCLHSTNRHKTPKRTDTYFMCADCNKPLCAVPCFNEYHTQVNI